MNGLTYSIHHCETREQAEESHYQSRKEEGIGASDLQLDGV